jgi:hypothetical protein
MNKSVIGGLVVLLIGLAFAGAYPLTTIMGYRQAASFDWTTSERRTIVVGDVFRVTKNKDALRSYYEFKATPTAAINQNLVLSDGLLPRDALVALGGKSIDVRIATTAYGVNDDLAKILALTVDGREVISGEVGHKHYLALAQGHHLSWAAMMYIAISFALGALFFWVGFWLIWPGVTDTKAKA